jgi:UDPglucose--hexose-1-phosphate uridylyltransferase
MRDLMSDAVFPQWRQDPLTGRMTIIAPARQERPFSIGAVEEPATSGAPDPFLEGNESQTPPEVLAIRDSDSRPDQPGWQVRIIPNLFAAMADLESAGQSDDLAVGIHEVVVECPHFETCLSRLSADHVSLVFRACRDRLKALARDRRLASAVLFKNKGAAAGASLGHAHSQIIAGTFVPEDVQRELTRCESSYQADGVDPFAKLIEAARADDRIVAESADMIGLCPYASRFPYEVCVLPKKHHGWFKEISESDVVQLGRMMRDILLRLDRIHDETPYNFVLHSTPFHVAPLPWYRWHFEIYPRLAGLAGYETGAGCFINPVPPEAAAARFRSVVAN